MAVREVSSHRSFGVTVKVFEHDSYATQTPMKFSVFLPQKERGLWLFTIWQD